MSTRNSKTTKKVEAGNALEDELSSFELKEDSYVKRTSSSVDMDMDDD